MLATWLVVVPGLAVSSVAAFPDEVAAAEASVVAQEAPSDGPAVSIPEAGDEEEELPWTNRYLAPTVIVMGLVVIALSAIGYGIRVRGRYRVAR